MADILTDRPTLTTAGCRYCRRGGPPRSRRGGGRGGLPYPASAADRSVRHRGGSSTTNLVERWPGKRRRLAPCCVSPSHLSGVPDRLLPPEPPTTRV